MKQIQGKKCFETNKNESEKDGENGTRQRENNKIKCELKLAIDWTLSKLIKSWNGWFDERIRRVRLEPKWARF